jgi:hypothetical protein
MRSVQFVVWLLLVGLAGCGSNPTGTVTGSVSLNGQPLEKAYISFASQDGQGGTAGSEVLQGSYRIDGLQPGKYVVHVAGQPTGPIIMPGAPEAQRKLSDQEIQAMMDPLPPDAQGNDQTIEVKAGEQTHDLRLETKRAS